MLLHLNDFKGIYDQYNLMVYNVALHYLQNVEDAEEITQDVFVQVHGALAQFKNDSTLKTWIYRITINKCLDFIKHKNSKKRFFIFGKKANTDVGFQKVSDFEHPGILLENKENAQQLFAVINQLPENQKTAFMLAKLDGLSNPEIADVMQLSISAVESLVFRAKSALREKLSEKFESHRKKK